MGINKVFVTITWQLFPLLLPGNKATSIDYSTLHFTVTTGDVLLKLLELLRRTSFPIDLGSLARVEKCITEHFTAPTFDSLGNGSFLHFLTTQEKAIKALGGSLIGAHSNSSHTVSTKRRLLELVSQLKQEKRKNQVR